MVPIADDFDASAYMSSPRLDVPSQITLGWQLLAAAPDDLPKPAEVCKRALRTTTRLLEDGFKTLQSADPAQLKRPIDLNTDNAWGCVKTRLEPYTWLDEQRFTEAGRAKVLMQKLFPTGLAFTKIEYGAQWAEASWRMKLIAEDKLEPELRRLCGDLFIDELLHWHEEYGKMVGVVTTRARRGARVDVDRERPNLLELLRQAALSVVAWQAQLVALHLAGHPGARAALRPTDEYRAKMAASPRTPIEPPVPTPDPTPIPPTPTPA